MHSSQGSKPQSPDCQKPGQVIDFKAIPALNKMQVAGTGAVWNGSSARRTSSPLAVGQPAKTTLPRSWTILPAKKGLSVGFVTAAALVHEADGGEGTNADAAASKANGQHKLLIIDELGFVLRSAKPALELLFRVDLATYERPAQTLITSNLPFDEMDRNLWLRTPCTGAAFWIA